MIQRGGHMQEKMGSGNLLDDRGRLEACGWATSEVRRYDRGAIRAHPLRTKEWDYYCVLTDRYGLALTLADNDYLGFAGITWLDFETPASCAEDVVVPLPMGKLGLPASADSSDVVFSHKTLEMAFRHVPGGRQLSVKAPGFDKGRGLSGEIFLRQPEMDRMVIATPFPGAPKAFYYNQKINCLAAEGEIVIGSETFPFQPDQASGVLDWGRGVWTYDNTWYWGSASGRLNGRPFGFNIGHGFGDTSAASENMLFLDGIAHKLDEVTFHLPDGPLDKTPWRFSSNDGRFEMTFAPVLNRDAHVNLGVMETRQDQVFGHFSGDVVLDDGTSLHIDRLLGFAEEVHNRW